MYPGRTTQDLMSAIVELDLVTFPDVSQWINMANELVTELCVNDPLAAGLVAYTDNRLTLIETQLAVHSYCMGPDPRASSERAGPVSQTLWHKAGFCLNGSHYGQNAMILDTNGFLASLNNVTQKVELPKGGVGVFYLGQNPRRRRYGGCW